MGKIIEGLFGRKGIPKKDVKNFLKRKSKSRTICYVLITCHESKEDGKMDVEMKYEGDKYLASYMIDTASKIMQGE
ncbi:MAG: hypothetical protein S4CHLAM20_03050 [Chlamydiia bacterium]|nr:hypothetical protein [Chlamydiia bacterium]